MSPNSDNVMARFLFAILKQKNLKDVDWNQVASDPVLLEPISNGHAARMRYSRFRATVTGQPRSRRARTAEKPRGSRAKRDQQAKKDKPMRSASLTSLSECAQFSPSSIASPYLETQNDLNARFLTPCSDDMTQRLSINPDTTHQSDTQDDFNARFLTPCSEDRTQRLSINPAKLEDTTRQSGTLFPAAMDCNSDFLSHGAGHDHISASHSPAFSAFDAAYDLNSYGSGLGDIHNQAAANPNTSQSLEDCTHDWSDRFHDQPQF